MLSRIRSLVSLLVTLVILLVFAQSPAGAQQYTWANFAGKPGGYGNVDGLGAAARFNVPQAVAVDGNGNIYVADHNNNAIRKITPAGVVTTIVGSQFSLVLNTPSGVAVDASGNVFISDTGNHTIRKFSAAGVLTTIAGKPQTSGSANGTGDAARFAFAQGIALDTAGNIYVADTVNHTIRKVTQDGVVTTLAGSPGATGTVDGTGSNARFNYPTGVVVDTSGNIYVADQQNYAIRKVTPAGVVTTLAGSLGVPGSANGTGAAARFNGPASLVLDSVGDLYVTDIANHAIRKVTSLGVVTTFAGSLGSSGSADGTGNAARFYGPYGLGIDTTGNLYVGDRDNNLIRKITASAVVTTVAGSVANVGTVNSTGIDARFNMPKGAALDSSGNLYVSEQATIRKISSSGVVTTLAGNPNSSGSDDGLGGNARFFGPAGVAVDGSGNVFVADQQNHTIRKITSAGSVSTYAGSAGVSGNTDNAMASKARFYAPAGVAVDTGGNVYVADAGNHTVRKITSAGVVTTLAGSAGLWGMTDGTGSAARFYAPVSVAVDSTGNVYVADQNNHAIRKVTSAGVVTTVAGAGSQNSGSADGTGTAARFWDPAAVAVDASGNLYVCDSGNNTIRKITSGGVVTTIGGTALLKGGSDGFGTAAIFSYSRGIAVSSTGTLFVVDTGNHRISKGVPGLPGLNASAVTNLAGSTVTLNGSVVPNGTSTTAFWHYGTTTGYGSFAPVFLNPTNGLTAQNVIANLTGLAPHTTYHYRLTASNTAGSAATEDATFTTNSFPTASAGTGSATTGDTATITLPYPVTDADGDAVSVQSVSASAGAPFTLGSVSGNTVQVTGASNATGAGTISFTVADGYGGTASGSVNVTVTDNDAPVITGTPGNITVPAASAAGAVVSFTAPTAADNIGVSTFTASHASGGTFPPGVTTVTFQSSDAAGNSSNASFTVTVLSAQESWRQTWFGATGNTGTGADGFDANLNGISNLMEYALGGNPVGQTTGTTILPRLVPDAPGPLQLTFTRLLDRFDLKLTVYGADQPAGPWVPLATSLNGGAFSVTTSGAAVTESGAGNTRTVVVTDLYLPSDPAHPRRFLKLEATR